MNRRLLLCGCGAFLAAGCAVGPDYRAPEPAAPAAWHATLDRGLRPGAADTQDLATWWTRLGDPMLNRLEERAVAANLDLRQALARVREARARRGVAQADLYPSVAANAKASRSRGSAEIAPRTTTTLYDLGFDASWEIDLFGGTRRSVEAAQADLEASEADLRDALVTLSAEVARNYLDLRTQQARLASAEANLQAQADTYRLAKDRYDLGAANRLAAEQARYNLESTRSQVPPLRTVIEQAKSRLAVLLGQAPGSLAADLDAAGPLPTPPADVAVGIPADTLRRRPDVRRAERKLAAQTARIGVATAELYPKLSLLGSIGLESLLVSRLWGRDAVTQQLAASGSWSLFDAGRVRRNIDVQNALQEQALAAYEAAVLQALEEVESGLVAYGQEQQRRDSLATAVEAARQAEKVARDRYEVGATDFQSVLDAQRSRLSLEDQLAASQGQVVANLASLYKALGGGWETLPPAGAAAEAKAEPGSQP
jgi:NodT family efflux transporter outer membrane factor (OMF) lipoprotein